MPAVNLKIKEPQRRFGLPGSKKNTKKSAKVVNLLVKGRGRKKQATLSPAKREELVLVYRLKARKLARSILRKWRSRLDLQEVDSIVDLSLCEAVRRFNPNRGASFMTFLYYHMRGNLIRAVSAAASQNLVPVGDVVGSGQQPERTPEEYHTNAIEVAEALCGNDYPLPDETLYKKEVAQLSHGACEKLDALEREVIFRIYMEEQQLMDIAGSLGYSRCHISRVKKKALETLYGDLTRTLGIEGQVTPPNFSETETDWGSSERRKVHRRRPRSRKFVAAVVEEEATQAAA